METSLNLSNIIDEDSANHLTTADFYGLGNQLVNR
jgi:hypothetical protein